MKKINWKDIGIRCLKTFIQGFLASLCVTSINGIDALKSALIGALAGVSAPFVTGDHIDIPANSVIRIALGNNPSKQGDHATIIAEQVSNITFTGVLA